LTRNSPSFLDQELAQIVKDAELGKRLLDKLVQVATHDGGEHWVYVHIVLDAESLDEVFDQRPQ